MIRDVGEVPGLGRGSVGCRVVGDGGEGSIYVTGGSRGQDPWRASGPPRAIHAASGLAKPGLKTKICNEMCEKT